MTAIQLHAHTCICSEIEYFSPYYWMCISVKKILSDSNGNSWQQKWEILLMTMTLQSCIFMNRRSIILSKSFLSSLMFIEQSKIKFKRTHVTLTESMEFATSANAISMIRENN